jgi:dolichol-phosphate mannosyltransferase
MLIQMNSKSSCEFVGQALNHPAVGSDVAVATRSCPDDIFPFAHVFGNSERQAPEELVGCVTVIIPIYNEVEHVSEIIRLVKDAPVLKEIVIIDDGSTDGTREKLLAISEKQGITLVLHDRNFGKGAAIRTALRYARGEYVLIQDSDLEYDPRDYAALIRPLAEGKANVVYGVRPDRPERGLMFFYGARFLTCLTNLLYGAGIHDEATCYKAFRRSLVERLNLGCQRFEFCAEVTAKVSKLGEKIWEVPVSYIPRNKKAGKKITYSDGWASVWALLRYRFTLSSRAAWLSNPEQQVDSLTSGRECKRLSSQPSAEGAGATQSLSAN